MVEVLGIPLLLYQLHWLHAYGFTSVVLACGHKYQFIQENLPKQTLAQLGIALEFSVEEKPLGKSGAVKKALLQMGKPAEPVLVANGDIITNLNLSEMMHTHSTSGSIGTIAVVSLVSTMGIVTITEKGTIESFCEKPELPYWMNAGIYMFSPAIYDFLPEEGDESLVFPELAKQGLLSAYRSSSYYRAIDTEKDLALANQEIAAFLFREMYGQQNGVYIQALRG